jgi:transcriptional regulator with XRE-family HTH domain
MTGEEMKAIRQRLGLSTSQLGRAFGYMGKDNTASVLIRTYESNGRPVPLYLERLLIMYDRYGIPEGWTERPAAKAAEG